MGGSATTSAAYVPRTRRKLRDHTSTGRICCGEGKGKHSQCDPVATSPPGMRTFSLPLSPRALFSRLLWTEGQGAGHAGLEPAGRKMRAPYASTATPFDEARGRELDEPGLGRICFSAGGRVSSGRRLRSEVRLEIDLMVRPARPWPRRRTRSLWPGLGAVRPACSTGSVYGWTRRAWRGGAGVDLPIAIGGGLSRPVRAPPAGRARHHRRRAAGHRPLRRLLQMKKLAASRTTR